MTEVIDIEKKSNGFIPLEQIPIDTDATLEQLTANFQGVRPGLPELVKNSSDAYSRRGIEQKEKRHIVVIMRDGINGKPSRLGVLDFAGTTLEDFEGDQNGEYDGWCKWSSRVASKKEISQLIEGGHGNGGKAFMTRGCKIESSLTSSYNGLMNKMGFKLDYERNRFHPGWFSREGIKISNLPDINQQQSLQYVLLPFGIEFESLPIPIKDYLNERKTWTMAELVGMRYIGDPEGRHWTGGFVKTILEVLKTHPQTNFAIESSQIWVYHNNMLLTPEPLTKGEIESYPGFEDHIISVPEKLFHPITNMMISTINEGEPQGTLLLKTSKKNLRTGSKNQVLNCIKYRNNRNIVAIQHISKYTDLSGGNYIYGTLTLNTLQNEHLDGTTRQNLAETPLTEALEYWIGQQIEILAQEIESKFKSKDNILDKRKTDNRIAELRELMREFLDQDFNSPDEGSEDEKGPFQPKVRIKRKGYGLILSEIILEDGRELLNIPKGVYIPIKYTCKDDEGRTVSNIVIAYDSEDKCIVDINPDEGIKGINEGTTEIWVRDTSTGITSNKIKVNIYEIDNITLKGPSEPIKQGQRVRIQSLAVDIHGNIIDDLALKYSPEPIDSASVGRMGYFTAGNYEGEVEVTAEFGEDDNKSTKIIINVLGERDIKTGGTEGTTSSIPYIVLCGRDAPGYSHLSKEQRTYYAQETEATILDDHVIWRPRGIIWINPESAESRRILKRAGGATPRAKKSTKTYTEFLAIKCFEILRRLKALQNLEGRTNLEPDTVISELNTAETDCAEFIDLSFDLIDSWEF